MAMERITETTVVYDQEQEQTAFYQQLTLHCRAYKHLTSKEKARMLRAKAKMLEATPEYLDQQKDQEGRDAQ